ncbi:MAG: hypothetical protein QMC38_08295, partial [Sinobacterium sp.]
PYCAWPASVYPALTAVLLLRLHTCIHVYIHTLFTGKVSHMKINPRFCLLVAMLSYTALLCSCNISPTSNSSTRANALFDELFMESLQRSPQRMTYMGMRERYGEWDDYSQDAADESIVLDKKQLAQLNALDAASLDSDTLLSLSLYRQRLQNSIDDVQ